MNIAINLLVFYEVIKQNIYEKAKVKLFTGQTLNKQTDFSLIIEQGQNKAVSISDA